MKPEIVLKPEFVEFIPEQLEERTLYYYSARSYRLDSLATAKLCLSSRFMETRP